MMETLRAAFVIGRRDFTAIIFSKAFFFFLLGPMFPILVGVAAGSLSGQVARDMERPTIGVAMVKADSVKMLAARETLAEELGDRRLPVLKEVPPISEAETAEHLLKDKKNGLIAVLSGTLDKPVMTGTKSPIENWEGEIALISAYAKSGGQWSLPDVDTRLVKQSAGNVKQLRLVTAQSSQVLLFMLTMLLAGMVLSNLVEEKSNKIIEILAASVPMDAVVLETVIRRQVEAAAEPPDRFGIVPDGLKKANVGVRSGNVGIARMDDQRHAHRLEAASRQFGPLGGGGGR